MQNEMALYQGDRVGLARVHCMITLCIFTFIIIIIVYHVHRFADKSSRNSSVTASPLAKSLSVPSPSVPNSEQPPPTNLLVSKKVTAFSSSSPHSSPSSVRKSKGPSTAKGQTSITPTSSKSSVATKR